MPRQRTSRRRGSCTRAAWATWTPSTRWCRGPAPSASSPGARGRCRTPRSGGPTAPPCGSRGRLTGATPRADLTLLYDPSSDAGDPAKPLLDRSGHGNHGTLAGARWVSELGGRVFELLGTGEHILMPGHPLSDLGDKASLSL